MSPATPHRFDRLLLTTARLTLRPLQDADAGALFSLFSDPRVMRYWSSPPWIDVARAHELIATDLAAMHDGEYVRLGLQIRNTGELVGTCTLFNFNSQCRRAELGYALHGDWWGRGYMHEALVALLGVGFDALGLNRVEADVDPRNVGSVKSLERLGFRNEGLLRERWIVNGEVSDSGLYGLLEREWAAGAKRRIAAANRPAQP
jgi:ribosomal-protein-alanine N-acetyltransferase